ncbi:hypothetical protein K0M31_010221 [Melipona bicolor]|uniref:Uncharacterized protein n=1 Tax=Melipona bicolor TaxID=60889 RepID=A0AA40KID6_9HYME|nr:hypothetical protein K0M31_010221 [Melipona bicolor]
MSRTYRKEKTIQLEEYFIDNESLNEDNGPSVAREPEKYRVPPRAGEVKLRADRDSSGLIGRTHGARHGPRLDRDSICSDDDDDDDDDGGGDDDNVESWCNLNNNKELVVETNKLAGWNRVGNDRYLKPERQEGKIGDDRKTSLGNEGNATRSDSRVVRHGDRDKSDVLIGIRDRHERDSDLLTR